MERTLVPISDLMINDSGSLREIAQRPAISFACNFPPHVPIDKIGVDLRRVQQLCDLSGIWRVTVSQSSDDSVSQAVPEVSGMTGQGGLLGTGKQTIDEVPTSDSNWKSLRLRSDQPSNTIWAQVGIQLHFQEIAQRILTNSTYSEGIRSVNGWSDMLDQSISNAIRATGGGYLLKNNDMLAKYLYIGGLMGVNAWGAIFVGLGGNLDIESYFLSFSTIPLVVSAIGARIGYSWSKDQQSLIRMVEIAADYYGEDRELPPTDLVRFRPSLIYGPQLDRWLKLQFVARRSGLIAPMQLGGE